MFENLQVFRLASAMASHAGKRQALSAGNMANADTPGYKPRDLVPFRDLVTPGSSGAMRATRPQHLGAASHPGGVSAAIVADESTDPNENGVSIELEMLRAVEIKRQHDRALTVYKTSLGILRTSLGRR